MYLRSLDEEQGGERSLTQVKILLFLPSPKGFPRASHGSYSSDRSGAKGTVSCDTDLNTYAPSPVIWHYPFVVYHQLTSWLTYLPSVSLHSHMSSRRSVCLCSPVYPYH